MAVQKAGDNFVLSNQNIRQINSPQPEIGGPYAIIHTDQDRWALVTLEWDGDPRLGIRWFTGPGAGTPQSSGYATWFIVPAALNASILSAIQGLSPGLLTDVNNFLNGTLPGKNLLAKYP